jgi:hypothetical protein
MQHRHGMSQSLGLAGALLLLAAGAASAQQAYRIGEAITVIPSAIAKGELEGPTENLVVGASVHANDVVQTGPNGRTSLEFLDKARFEVGPNSNAKLDKFVFNPDQTAQEATISMTKGLFRFVSGGKSQHGTYTLSTPHATLGIRGTDLTIYVSDSATTVSVSEGHVDGCNKAGTTCQDMGPQGETTAATFSNNGAVTPPTGGFAPAGGNIGTRSDGGSQSAPPNAQAGGDDRVLGRGSGRGDGRSGESDDRIIRQTSVAQNGAGGSTVQTVCAVSTTGSGQAGSVSGCTPGLGP